MSRRLNEWPEWPNARDWIGIGVFVLTVMILWMVKEDQSLRRDEFFKTIATLIIGTGFINGVVSWAYAATKGGGEQAEVAARIAEQAATAAVSANPTVGDMQVDADTVNVTKGKAK